MAVTNLFKIGHLPYKIVKFTKFSMKQVCKPKKKPTLMLTLIKVVVSFQFFFRNAWIKINEVDLTVDCP